MELTAYIDIPCCDVEMIQQVNEPLHPYPLESLATDELDRAHDEPLQPRGERKQIVKTNKMSNTEAK